MSEFFYSPIVRVNVPVDFSMVVILTPNDDIYRKAFKIKHLVKEIKKVEKEFNMEIGIFMESIGVYYFSFFTFLKPTT